MFVISRYAVDLRIRCNRTIKSYQDFNPPLSTSPFLSLSSTDWILKEAEKSNVLVGVVGWVDLQDPEVIIITV